MRARPRQDRYQYHEAEGDQRERDRQEDEQGLHARRSVAPDPPAYTGRRAASPPRVARLRRHAHSGLPRRQPASRLRSRDDRLRCRARRHLGERRGHRDGHVRPGRVALVPHHDRRRLEDRPILGAAHAPGRSAGARCRAARRHRHPGPGDSGAHHLQDHRGCRHGELLRAQLRPFLRDGEGGKDGCRAGAGRAEERRAHGAHAQPAAVAAGARGR